jgi:hypothetical protein
MWQKLTQNQDISLDYSFESQAYDYILGESTPSKPDFNHIDGGIIVTIRVPTMLVDWKTIFQDKESPLFQVYRYLPMLDDKTELVHEEFLKDTVPGLNRIKSNLYLSPGRYYFKLSNCKIASCPPTSFIPENSFIMLNDCHDKDDIPVYHQTPTSSLWLGFYELNFRIRKADLYLGFESNKLPDHLLLEGAFYHSIDPDGIVRTFIYHDKQQFIEGQKI